jgi:hypothetical protein
MLLAKEFSNKAQTAHCVIGRLDGVYNEHLSLLAAPLAACDQVLLRQARLVNLYQIFRGVAIRIDDPLKQLGEQQPGDLVGSYSESGLDPPNRQKPHL